MQKIEPSFLLKDQLFNKQKVEYLSWLIKKVYPDFLIEEFEKEVLNKFPELELKQRIYHISDTLKKYIWDKNDFEKAVNIMIKSLPELEDNWTLDNNFWDFIFTPYCDYIRKFWCNKINLKFSLESQAKITPYASSEDSIRYFFNKFEEQTFAKMLEWSKSDNYFLRRLASEGSRAKLPWCQKINVDYKKPIEILDNLYTDESRYVTRSVANHLNDIAKIDWNLVIEILARWKNDVGYPQGSRPTDLDYIISHWTRTLVKQWHKKTLEFLGYSTNPQVRINNFNIINKEIKIWESLEFSLDISGCIEGEPLQENLIIDYKIYFLNKSWKLLPKVFKIKKCRDTPCRYPDVLHITKKHKLKIMTTKALYEWEHFVEIVINGKNFWKKSFELI